jgi:hypothetical protein
MKRTSRTFRTLLTTCAAALALATFGVGTATAATPACNLAKTSLAEAKATDTTQQRALAALKTQRATKVNAGDVAAVGQLNVQIGSASGYANTTDSALASAQARKNRDC